MLINAQQMLSNAQQCSAMLSNAQQCSAMLSNEFQRDSKRIVMLIRLNVFFKKLMSSPPSPPHPHPPPPNQRIRGAPRSLGGAPKKMKKILKKIRLNMLFIRTLPVKADFIAMLFKTIK